VIAVLDGLQTLQRPRDRTEPDACDENRVTGQFEMRNLTASRQFRRTVMFDVKLNSESGLPGPSRVLARCPLATRLLPVADDPGVNLTQARRE